MSRLLALNAEWRRNPPLPLMVKAFLGIQEESGTSATAGKPNVLPKFATLPDIEE